MNFFKYYLNQTGTQVAFVLTIVVLIIWGIYDSVQAHYPTLSAEAIRFCVALNTLPIVFTIGEVVIKKWRARKK